MSWAEAFATLLKDFWKWVFPLFIIQEYEQGVHIRKGKFLRILTPGLYWKVPFGYDEVLQDNVVTGSHDLGPLSLTTQDGVDVVVEPTILWRISDIKTFLLTVEGREAVLADSSAGYITNYVESHDWEEVSSHSMVESLLPDIQDHAGYYGVAVEDLVFKSKVRCRSLRLWNQVGSGE